MPGPRHLVPLLSVARETATTRGLTMLGLLAAVLGGFLLLLMVIGLARHLRRRAAARSTPAPEPGVDAWREAGRRIRAGDDDDDPDGEDDDAFERWSD